MAQKKISIFCVTILLAIVMVVAAETGTDGGNGPSKRLAGKNNQQQSITSQKS